MPNQQAKVTNTNQQAKATNNNNHKCHPQSSLMTINLSSTNIISLLTNQPASQLKQLTQTNQHALHYFPRHKGTP